jgi:hypothetical protein
MWWLLFGLVPKRQLVLALLLVSGAQFLGIDVLGMAWNALSDWIDFSWLDLDSLWNLDGIW